MLGKQFNGGLCKKVKVYAQCQVYLNRITDLLQSQSKINESHFSVNRRKLIVSRD